MRRDVLRSTLFAALLLVVLAFSGCGASVVATPTPAPRAKPTLPAPPGTFYFATDDGVTLNGRILGEGKTALIFSNGVSLTMESWRIIAEQLSTRGYMCLLYDYRGLGQSQGESVPRLRDHDLRAAVAVAREHGATKIVLIGASFGGMLSAKLAKETGAAAIVLASASLSSSGIWLTSDDLRGLTMPKLLVASQNDGMSASNAQDIYEASPQPKEMMVYPGRDHGSALFYPGPHDDPLQRMTTFLDKYAPA